MNSGHASLSEQLWKILKLSSLYCADLVISQVCRTDSRNMSYSMKLLSILVFILLYSDHIIFWLPGCVSLLALETGLGSGYGGSNELTGKYLVVFHTEELIYRYRLQPNCGFI